MAVETGGARLYSRSRIELPRDASVIRLAAMAVETGGARSRGLICVVGLPGLPSLLEETKFLPLHTLLYTRGKSQFALKKMPRIVGVSLTSHKCTTRRPNSQSSLDTYKPNLKQHIRSHSKGLLDNLILLSTSTSNSIRLSAIGTAFPVPNSNPRSEALLERI
jgi:hypothetical protein